MKYSKSCASLEDHLGYLRVIKGRSECMITEYRTDVLMFFTWLMVSCGEVLIKRGFSFVNTDFIRSITSNEMYAFLSYYQKERNANALFISRNHRGITIRALQDIKLKSSCDYV